MKTPLCEFNCNDIGWALYVLTKLDYELEARNWLFELMEFLVTQFNFGYRLLPLDKPLTKITEILDFTQSYEKNNIQSYLFGLLFEYILILDAKETFDKFRSSKPISVTIQELRTISEAEIYEPDYIQATTVYIDIPETTYDAFKFNHPRRLQALYLPWTISL